MALQVWNGFAQDDAGNVLASASVEVRDKTDNSLASVFEDRGGVTPLGNPFTSDATGQIEFYVIPGRYKITATKGASQVVFDNVVINYEASELVPTVATLAALQAVSTTGLVDGESKRDMDGRTSAGDGGEGRFVWRSGDQSANVSADEVTSGQGDGGIWVAPTSDLTGASGAWERIGIEAITPEMYGGFTTAADVTAAIQQMMNSMLTFGLPVELNRGQYVQTGEVIFDPDSITTADGDGLTISFNGKSQIKYTGSDYAWKLQWKTVAGGASPVSVLKNPRFLGTASARGAMLLDDAENPRIYDPVLISFPSGSGFHIRNVDRWSENVTIRNARYIDVKWHLEFDTAAQTGGSGTNSFARFVEENHFGSGSSEYWYKFNGDGTASGSPFFYHSRVSHLKGNRNTDNKAIFLLNGNFIDTFIEHVGVEGGSATTSYIAEIGTITQRIPYIDGDDFGDGAGFWNGDPASENHTIQKVQSEISAAILSIAGWNGDEDGRPLKMETEKVDVSAGVFKQLTIGDARGIALAFAHAGNGGAANLSSMIAQSDSFAGVINVIQQRDDQGGGNFLTFDWPNSVTKPRIKYDIDGTVRVTLIYMSAGF